MSRESSDKRMSIRVNAMTKSSASKCPSHLWVALLVCGALAVGTWTGGLVHAQDQNPSDQQPPSSEPQLHHLPGAPVGKISSSIKLVTVYATARDKHGKIAPGLTKDDFVLEEDGRPQTISHFIVQTDVPLTLGLLVDTSFSQRAMIVPERQASYTFLDHLLTTKDVAFVIHFDRDIELLQDLTSSRAKLQAALQQLDTPQLNRDNDNGGNGGGGDDRGQRGRAAGGGTHLYDAIWLASNDIMKKQQGRKAVFVLSDGVDRGSKESITDAIEAAQRADTSVYTIYFAGEEHDNDGYERHRRWGGGVGGGWPGGGGGWPGGGGGGGGNQYPREPRVDGKKILLQISEQTGGVMFEVSKNLPLDKIYSVAEEGLRNQYSIGYTPNPPDTDPGYHTIHLTANKKDLAVQARQGYYSGP